MPNELKPWYIASCSCGNDSMAKRPCIGCVYFKACGETNRTMPCYGRVTKSERRRANDEQHT